MQLKFKQKLICALTLGELIADQIANHWYLEKARPQLIIPVPLHLDRLKQRGFNQALEIARPISQRFAIPIDKFGLKRTKATLPQSGLSALKRKDNVKAAFECPGKYDNLCIALIDDVVTTAATIAEISALLKKMRAKSIHVWCCARRG